jgi:hypothetical protein
VRSLDVACLHVPDQARQSAEFPLEGRVHHVHVAGIRRNRNVVSGRFDHAMFAARGCASATVDSHGPLVDSVLIVADQRLILGRDVAALFALRSFLSGLNPPALTGRA